MMLQPINQRATVAAVYVDSFSDEQEDANGIPAGHWHFYTQYGDETKAPAGILFGCPCGCGTLHSVGFDTHESQRPRWHWDGNRESPTLTPSINILQHDDAGNRIGEHWHGFLTTGEFRSC